MFDFISVFDGFEISNFQLHIIYDHFGQTNQNDHFSQNYQNDHFNMIKMIKYTTGFINSCTIPCFFSRLVNNFILITSFIIRHRF